MTDQSDAKGYFDRLIDVLALIAGVLICVLIVVITLDVFSRNTKLFSMPWSLDVAEYTLMVITFFGAPWVLREQGHIVVDLMLQNLSPKSRRSIERFAHVLGAIVCGVLTYFFTLQLVRSFQLGNLLYETFTFPEWYIYTVAPPTFLILTIIFVRWVIRPPEPRAGGEGM
jgi:TRAP-type C4-dicarboxylate transport system permease small subunit